MDAQQPNILSRRAVLAGIGAASGAVLFVPAARAGAVPLPLPLPQPGSTGKPLSLPGNFTTIASTPEAGVSYQFRSFYDFMPTDNWAWGRQWGGSGVYTPTTGGVLLTTLDAPPGAILSDVEWYTANTVAASWGVGAWRAGAGGVYSLGSGSIPAGGAGVVTAHKIDVAPTFDGPFPHGSRLVAFITTPTNGTVQVNGVRLGFAHGALNPVTFSNPKRVYDSRKHTPLAGGSTRTISLATSIPPVTQAVMIAVTVLNTHGSGSLDIGAGGKPPVASALSWTHTGDKLTNSLTTNASTSRQIAIRSLAGSGSTDFVVDLIGYIV